VFIAGQPVALEDQSYFATSTGNEAATYSFGKGLATGVLKGKTYFRSWSMDVMIEGKGVARHLDLMTHNHGSHPGNTPMFPYISRSNNGKHDCEKEAQRIDDSCKTEGDAHWTEVYCSDLQYKARGLSNAKAYEELKNVRARMTAELDGKTLPKNLKKLRNQYARLKERAAPFQGVDNLSSDSKRREAQTLAAEGQGLLATLNPCTRALKCRLIPYKSSDDQTETAVLNRNKENQKRGCCPGQTGHHLIYDKMVKNANLVNKETNCPGYNAGDTPTVCVEGTNQYHGTHGLVHDRMDDAVKDKVKNSLKEGEAPRDTISMDDAIDAAAQSHTEAFPRSGCSKNCIKAQLESYYKDEKVCLAGARVMAIDKQGNLHNPRKLRGYIK